MEKHSLDENGLIRMKSVPYGAWKMAQLNVTEREHGEGSVEFGSSLITLEKFGNFELELE